MAHESFEDDEVAALLNARFPRLKVDREERPDVDAVYMEAVQLVNGSGGWPMTVLALPDGRPFWAGTYLRKAGLHQALEPGGRAVGRATPVPGRRRRPVGRSRAQRRRAPRPGAVGRPRPAQGLDAPGRRRSTTWPGPVPLAGPTAARTPGPNRQGLDGPLRPGVGRLRYRPQVPPARVARRARPVLLAHGGAIALEALCRSLDAMSSGGIYDHLAGGFARYSTDRYWLVPHFEKMLYDNALLVRAYARAWQLTGRPATARWWKRPSATF